jgi:hypothetical protein
MHENNPWMGINGVKTKGLSTWNWVSFKDCIALQKHTVITCGAAEKQESYMISSLKKPIKMTIQQQTMHRYLPMLKDSAMAVASTE